MYSRSAARLMSMLLLIPLVLTLLLLNNSASANATQNNAAQVPQSIAETILFDDFNNASLDSSVWVLASSSFHISDSVLTITPRYEAMLVSKHAFRNNDHILEFKTRLSTVQGGGRWGIGSDDNGQDTGPGFWFYDGNFRACAAYDAVHELPACETLSPFDATQWHTYKIEMKAEKARLFVDDKFVLEGDNRKCHEPPEFGCQFFVELQNLAGSEESNINLDYVRYTTGEASPPAVPQLYNINNDDEDGDYTVNWSTVANASGYELQERKNNESWKTIYNDSGSSKNRSEQADSEYCYRVRASNSAGSSGWSAVNCTAVDTTPQCFSLTISISPGGSGTVNKSPLPNCGEGKYSDGTNVKLTANATTGYSFGSWSGALSGGTNPVNLSMNIDKSVTAQFVQAGDSFIARQWWSFVSRK